MAGARSRWLRRGSAAKKLKPYAQHWTPRLKKASFYYVGNAHTREIMSHIAFPNLESLELAYLENVTPILHLLYAQALTRLPLKYLRIESCLFGEMKFINLLRKLPSLVTLELMDIEDISHYVLKVRCIFILFCFFFHLIQEGFSHFLLPSPGYVLSLSP